jgi:hypothetical protein
MALSKMTICNASIVTKGEYVRLGDILKFSVHIVGQLSLEIINKYIENLTGIEWSILHSELKNLTIGTTVMSIETRGFYDCPNFEGTLIIPHTVINIGHEAFDECPKLTVDYAN